METATIEGFHVSTQQRRLWHLQQESPAYLAECVLQLAGDLRAGELRRALERVVERHEILRTTFQRLPGRALPVQVIGEAAGSFEWREVEFGEESAVEGELEASRARPFDLENGPLVRGALLRSRADSATLILQLPALLLDALSLENLVEELVRAYARVRGAEAEAEEPVQYADFSGWQSSMLEEAEARAGEAFWRGRFEGPPSDSFRGLARVRQSGLGVFAPEVLDSSAIDRAPIDALPGRLPASSLSVVLAGVLALARRFDAGDERAEMIFGRVASGRSLEQLAGALGAFARSLPVTVRLQEDFEFREVVTRVEEFVREGEARQEFFSFDDGGDDGKIAYFPILVEERPPSEVREAAGVRFVPLRLSACSDRFTLCWTIVGGRRELALTVTYDASRYDAVEVERLADQLNVLLVDALAEPARKLAELEVLSPAERWQVLMEWNETARDGSRSTLPELLARCTASTPSAVAVRYGGGELTFARLDERTAALASRLRASGIGPESRVGVLLERSLDLIVAVLGVMRAGAAFVAMDPWQPRERLRSIVEAAGIRRLVTRIEDARGLDLGVETELTGGEGREAGAGAEAQPDREVRASARGLAYVMFTSGSTGRPKGVLVEHRSVTNLWEALRESVYGDAEGLRVSVNAPLSFDASIKQLVQLASGHTLVVVPEEVRPDGEALLSFLVSEGVDVLDTTPSQLRLLLSAGLDEAPAGPRTILVGGEAIDEELWRRLAADGARRYVNVYGPTECTVDVTARRVEGEYPLLGGPLRNVRTYVLDDRLQAVGVGWAGELFVGGAGVSRGYVGRPGETARRFVPDPFGGVPGGRLYGTGDQVRRRGDGSLEYSGRRDFQIKLRGVRVELGEIEAVLREHPRVSEAAVMVREDRPGDARLVAYVTGGRRTLESPDESVSDLTVSGLRGHARAHLPEAMLPSVFVILDELPLTRRGKVDRRALPAPETVAAREAVVEPATPFEEVLAEIWAEVLGLERIGVESNFFERGGHSLLATKLMSRACDAFDVELPLRVLFEAPTIREMALHVEGSLRAGSRSETPPIEPLPEDGAPRQLSFAQQRLWFIDQLEPGTSLFNIFGAFRLGGALDIVALERTLRELVRRHQILRTTLEVVDDVPVQRVCPASFWSPARADLSQLPDHLREKALSEIAEAEARRPFDLERGPLFRALLVRMADGEHAVVVTMHHIVSDAWSLGVLLRELGVLYEAYSTGRVSPLPELTIQYADFAAWQRRFLQGEVLEEHLGFWRRHLGSDLPVLRLPGADAGKISPADAGYARGGHLPFIVPAEVTAGLSGLAVERRATLYMVVLAAFASLLYRATEQDDMVLGTDIANRNRRETEGLIGFFINMLALRLDLSGNPTFEELLARVRKICLESYAYQDLPFDKLIEELQPERDLSHSPLFEVVLVMQNAASFDVELPGLELSSLPYGDDSVRFDLSLWIDERGDELFGVWRYRAGLFEEAAIEQLRDRFQRLLRSAVEEPSRRLDDLDFMSEGEQRQQAESRQSREASNRAKLRRMTRRGSGAGTAGPVSGGTNR